MTYLINTTIPILLLTAVATANISKTKNYRLPKKLVPTHYTLDLTIDPDNTTYHGFVEISITAKNRTNSVQLHASHLNITKNVALLDYETQCNVTSNDTETEIITITCHKNAFHSKHKLLLDFEGAFTIDDMFGIYKSSYADEGGESVLVATQFESAYARRVFPCFDEPSFKATFDVFVTHPDNYTVLGNTPVVRQFSIGPNLTQTQFETTPRMSTYLVALVVSKFQPSSNASKSNYDYRVIARPSAKGFMRVATTYGPRLIDLLSDFTGIAYEKLGNTQAYQVAIPDFAAGAMENWGLITYREVDLLDDGNKTSAKAKELIITTIAHEMAHHWFGDYVTLDWWSDTWLNEGFATYFQYYIPDMLEGESFELGKQFVINEVQDVLRKDALPSSSPLSSAESDINTPDEDDNKFDDVSYSKGASVIRMMKGIIGSDNFRKGLQSYLIKNQYNNTTPYDLLDEMQATNISENYDIATIMENWIYKAGFPLVTAKLNDTGTVVLTQERFTTAAANVSQTEWYVPISYTTSDEKDFAIRTKLLMEPNSTTQIEINEGSWIILNLQQFGFYRVNYDDTLWDRIILALKDDKQRSDIDVLNRAQLIDDIFNIARIGQIDYEKVFDLASYLNQETEYYPWASALNAMSYLIGKLTDEETKAMLSNVILDWINNAFVNSTSPETHIDHIKDTLIMDWACKLGQNECIKYALDAFNDYKKTKSLDDYNKKGIVFCNALRNSNNSKEDFDFLFNVFKTSTSSIEQRIILISLGCVSNSSLLSMYLSESISDNSSIRRQDAAIVFKAVYSKTDIGYTVALKFLEDNLVKVAARYKDLNFLSTIITGLAGKLTTDDDVNRLKKIITDHEDVKGLQKIGEHAMEIITTNRVWTDTYGSRVKSVLAAMEKNLGNVPKPDFVFSLVTSLICFYFYNHFI